jgi:hypothetical protein
MKITFPCTQCGHQYKVDGELAGKRIKCKRCGTVVSVPVPRRRRQPPSPAPESNEADPYGFMDEEPEAAPAELPRIQGGRSSAKKQSNHGLWVVLGGAGLALVVVVGGLWLTNALRSPATAVSTSDAGASPVAEQPSGSGRASAAPFMSKKITLPAPGVQIPGAEPGVPEWANQASGLPFDVRQFLEGRKPAADDPAPMYFAALAQLSDDMDFVVPPAEWQARLTRLKTLSQTIDSLRDEDRMRAGTVPMEPLERLLSEVQPAMDLLDQVSAKTPCVFVTGLRFDSLLSHAQAARHVARLAELQIYFARAKGRGDEAEKAVRRTLRLARDMRPRGPAICQLVAVAMDGVVLNSLNDLYLGQPSLTPAQCDRLLALLSEHERLAIDLREEALRTEYICMRNNIEDLRTGRLTPQKAAEVADSQAFRAMRTAGVNWQAEVAACNKFFADLLELARRTQQGLIPIHLIDKCADETKRTTAVAWMLLPAVKQLDEAAARDRTRLGATMSLIAVRRFQLAHQTVPETLEAAVGEAGLNVVPMDAYSGQPLRYRVVGGQPIVYSVGSDLKDDGGLVDWDPGKKPGDFVFRIGAVASSAQGSAVVRTPPTSEPALRPGPPPVAPALDFKLDASPQESARLSAQFETNMKKYHTDLLKYQESWERYIAKTFGRERTVKLKITGVSDHEYFGAVRGRVQALLEASGSEEYGLMINDTMTFVLGPIGDLAACAAKVDFGKVSRVDTTERVIYVTVSASTLDSLSNPVKP